MGILVSDIIYQSGLLTKLYQRITKLEDKVNGIEMWNKCHEDVKKIRLTSGDCVFADSYVIGENLIDFDLDNVTFGVFKFENIKGIECD